MTITHKLPLHVDVILSSGRTITHRYIDNGAQEAIPTTGDEEMTEAEWEVYVALRLSRQQEI